MLSRKTTKQLKNMILSFTENILSLKKQTNSSLVFIMISKILKSVFGQTPVE